MIDLEGLLDKIRQRAEQIWRSVRAELAAASRDRKRALGLLAFAAVGLASSSAGVALGAWSQACAGGCPTAEQVAELAPQEASVVLDAGGATLGLLYRERRQLVELETLPRHVPLAFVAVEDRRFFEHGGVDVVRFLAAVRDNLFGGWGGPGGSTITMQLARNLFPQQLPIREKSLRRKLAEIRLAREMEKRFSKERILELYLNHIYLGSGAYGVEAAARTYFGKPAAQLTVAEAATLAALPKAPSFYDPRRNPEAARNRRNLVLREMAETGVITEEEAETLRRLPLVLAPPRGLERAPYVVELVRRELEDRFGELLYTGGLRIYTTIDSALQAEAEAALEDHLREIESGAYGPYRHQTYEDFVEEAADQERVAQTPYLQGVVVVLDPTTGAVRALVGGRDFEHSQFNRATQALRQPGSAFKPFVYAAAIEKGRSPLSLVHDVPISVRQPDGTYWSPKNYDGTIGGTMTMREALRQSRNLATIRLGQEVGMTAVRNVARRAGLETPIPDYPSVYIGAAAVHPIDLVAAYGTFANAGLRVSPRFIRRIEDRNGEVLWEPTSAPTPALPPGLAWIVTDMLREVVDRGTGYNVRNPAVGNIPYDIPVAGKTGTTNSNTDVWFIGYTPDLLAGVWLGFDEPKTITSGATGGGFAVPVWARVVRKYYENHEVPRPWERPSGVIVRDISTLTGRPVTEDCPFAVSTRPDFFLASSAPEPGCGSPEEFVDPTPWLPGRPVVPGQPRVPRPEDFIDESEPGDGAEADDDAETDPSGEVVP
ncbi:MAG TPA: PBP1A family penicillin-binding protein [Longimicrobiaceae bacterium]